MKAGIHHKYETTFHEEINPQKVIETMEPLVTKEPVLEIGN